MTLIFTIQSQKIQWSNPARAPVEGSVGEVYAQFAVDSEWEGRTITVVFSNEEGGAPLPEPIMWTGDPVKVPSSVLVDGVLRVGLVGIKDGKTLTTQYMRRGVPVHRSGGTGGEAIDPNPTLWEQVLSAMGNLADLDTFDKSSLVAAINEVYRTGGGAGNGVDAAEVEKIVAAYIAANPYQETDPNVPSWAKQPNKPSYSAADVGADPAGTAGQKVGAHNVAADSHNDIRLLISGINDRLNAFFDSDDATLDELSEIVAYIKSNKSLIEAVTTSKVNVSDIINNLTTNVANKPLSAAQGVVLKVLIDDLTTSLSGYQPKGDYALRSELPSVPVKSVNGKTGAVQLTAADVKARADTWLPTPAAIGAATTEALSQLSAEKENKLDAAAYGLPILKLTGDASAMTKENAVSLAYEYGEMSGTASVKWQGGSSLNYPKKNYTINFDQAFEAADGWGTQKKYCLKANYIDFTHARNVVSARLWGQIVKSRKSVNSTLAASPNYGAVNGFPCVITLNGVFHGVYTFNIPKDKWMANMGSGTNECILCADSHVDATRFKAAATLNGDFDLEYATDESNSGWVTTSLNNLINACIATKGADLDTTIAAMLDWESAIDYYIFTVLLRGDDMTDKNYLLLTYDGTKWIFGGYDMDSTYGLAWTGKTFLSASDTTTFATYAGLHRLMYLIRNYKLDALKARYAELRQSVLSEDNVAKEFLNFVGQIPRPLLEEDNRTWPLIPSTNANSVQQILNWYRLRCAAIDEEVLVMDTVNNLVPTAVDYASDGIYNEVGYKNNSRWSSAEPHVRDWDGYVTTGLIQFDFPKTMAEATEDKYIYIKGCDGGAPFGDTDTNLSAIILWNPDKTYNGIANINNSKKCFNVEQLGEDYYRLTYKAGSDGVKTQFYGSFGYNLSDGSYFALGLKGSGDNMIVTIGEPIE